MLPEKVRKVLEQDRVLNLNIFGRLKFTDDYTFELSPNNDGILFKCGFWHVVYSADDNVARSLLKSINNTKEIGFSGVAEKYYNIAKEIHPIKWDEPCHLYYLEEADLNHDLQIHEVDSLKLSDAEIVNEFYTYKDEDSIEYIEECIQNRPTSVVRDAKGNPISWAVIREDGSLGVMYTLKEHRGNGYAISVSVDLAKKAFDLGLTPYIHIVKGNTPSIKLAKTLGFKYHCDIVWFGI